MCEVHGYIGSAVGNASPKLGNLCSLGDLPSNGYEVCLVLSAFFLLPNRGRKFKMVVTLQFQRRGLYASRMRRRLLAKEGNDAKGEYDVAINEAR